MVAMINGAKNPKAKLEGMIFVIEFQGRLDGYQQSVNDMIKACDEVRNSELLRKLIAITLALGNHINTGGESNGAAGFSLRALIELDNVSFFDTYKISSKSAFSFAHSISFSIVMVPNERQRHLIRKLLFCIIL